MSEQLTGKSYEAYRLPPAARIGPVKEGEVHVVQAPIGMTRMMSVKNGKVPSVSCLVSSRVVSSAYVGVRTRKSRNLVTWRNERRTVSGNDDEKAREDKLLRAVPGEE